MTLRKKSNQSLKMPLAKVCKHTVTQYAKSTSVHGIAYIFDETASLVEKLLWLVIFAIATFFAISFSTEIYHQWQNDPVFTYLNTTGKVITAFEISI